MGHVRGCAHCANVNEYRIARHADELACEELCKGGTSDHAEQLARADHPPMITFKAWLTGSRRNEHGYVGYTHGCRCHDCTTAKRDYMRAYRARRHQLEEAA